MCVIVLKKNSALALNHAIRGKEFQKSNISSSKFVISLMVNIVKYSSYSLKKLITALTDSFWDVDR